MISQYFNNLLLNCWYCKCAYIITEKLILIIIINFSQNLLTRDSGLGKNETGNTEAIPLHVKRCMYCFYFIIYFFFSLLCFFLQTCTLILLSARAGLGDEESRKRKINKISAKRAKLDEGLLSSFKGSMKNKFAARKLEGQLVFICLKQYWY